MKINNRNYDLNKIAKEITQDDISNNGNIFSGILTSLGKPNDQANVFSKIFNALDKADGKVDNKLNKEDIRSIFNSIKDVDNQNGKGGDNNLSDEEIIKLKTKLLPNLDVSIQDFKNFIIRLLTANENKFINVSLGEKKNGVRQVGPNNIAIRESRHGKLPAAKDGKTEPSNERIDAFKQGQRGDCYLLAEINAIKNTRGGQRIFKDNITKYEDGSVMVKLPGALEIKKNLEKNYPSKTNKIQITGQYKISALAVENAWRLAGDTYSEGDLDVILYEIAFESYRLELNETRRNLNIKLDDPRQISAESNVASNSSDVLSGGQSYDAGFLITAKTSDVYRANRQKYNKATLYKQGKFGLITREEMDSRALTNSKATTEIHNLSDTEASLRQKLQEYSGKEDKYALTFYVRVANNGPDGFTRAGGSHALTILKITKDTVYVLNPWNADAKGNKCIEPIPISDFINMCTGFVAHEVDNKSQNQNKLTTEQIVNILKNR